MNSGTSSSNKQWLITTDADIPLGAQITVNHTDADPARTFGTRAAVPAGVFTSTEFIDQYTYTGDDLGATYSAGKTDFRVWAPTASDVKLVTYTSASQLAADATVINMTSDVKGTWIASVNGDQHGLIDLNTMNSGKEVVINTPGNVRRMAKVMRASLTTRLAQRLVCASTVGCQRLPLPDGNGRRSAQRGARNAETNSRARGQLAGRRGDDHAGAAATARTISGCAHHLAHAGEIE